MDQCDQSAGLCVQYLAIYNNENLPQGKTISSKFCQNTKLTL